MADAFVVERATDDGAPDVLELVVLVRCRLEERAEVRSRYAGVSGAV